MPAIPQLHRSVGGLHMFLGLNPPVRDAASDKYHFARLMGDAAGQADLTKPKLLSDFDGTDYRIDTTNQGRMGACTCFTDQEVNYVLSASEQKPCVVHAGWLYQKVRQKENGANWQADSGAYENDVLDITMTGAPLASAAPYLDDPAHDYSSLDANADKANSYVLRHMPFYPKDGNILENIWTALANLQPVAIAMAWLNPFFNPSGGMLPINANVADVAGGHEIMGFGIVPVNGRVWVLASNHWTKQWASDAASFGYTMRPGDFAIPGEYFTAPNSIIWEVRAVTRLAIAPQPDPNPNPQPQPTPGQSCTAPALTVVDGVLKKLQSDAVQTPFNRPRHYRAEGAQIVRDAIAKSGI